MNAFLLKADKVALTLIFMVIIFLALTGCEIDTNGYRYKSRGVQYPVMCDQQKDNVLRCYSAR